jgi:hypothetical protein
MQSDWSDVWKLMERVQTDLAFAEIVRNAAKRTLICRPDDAGRLRWKIDQAGLGDVLTVVESPYSPEGQILVFDQQALDVSMNRMMTRPIHLF